MRSLHYFSICELQSVFENYSVILNIFIILTHALSFLSIIFIAGNKMRGIIPSELGQLKSLKNLDISKLFDEIFGCFMQLHLQYI